MSEFLEAEGAPEKPARPEADEYVETITEARAAIAAVLLKHPQLQKRVEETAIDGKVNRKRITKPCSECTVGTLHYVGRNVLPDGRLGLGGFVVCDQCGYHTTSR